MACGRLFPDRKLDHRLRVERNFSFHNDFSLIHPWRWRFRNNWPHENGLGGKRSSEVGTYPSPILSVGHF
jgi:hypothetical protein